jgi:hypothetical protein
MGKKKLMNRLVFYGAAGAGFLCATAGAQTVLQTATGSGASDRMGKSVAVVGDVDKDGHADIGIGVPYSDVGGADTGSIRIVSGANGQVLYTRHGLAAGDRLGESLAAAGDVNKDGYADFVAGAPLNDQNGLSAGMVRVWSGRDGSVLYTWFGDQPADWFGASVDGAGDVNNDGWDDVIVGAPFGKGLITSNIGEARIYSGRDGSVIRTHNAPLGVAVLGTSVSGAGDVNKDGWDDVIVGAPQSGYSAQDSGRAWVFSGKTGAEIFHWDGSGHGEYFAQCVDGGGDVNNDGWPDVIVGTPFSDYNGGNSGSVTVYSGKTGTMIHRFNGTASWDELGRACAIAGDIDGDGWADVVGGAKFKDQGIANCGMARVWSGRTGQPLFSVYGGSVDEQLGHAVAGGGDVNGDGLHDAIVGWPTFDSGGSMFDTGRVRVWSAAPLPITTYCTGSTNSAGCVASITTTGSPSAGASSGFTVRANQVLNQKTGQFFFGFHGQTKPYFNGTLCVKTPLIRTTSLGTGGNASGNDCTGSMSLDLNAWLHQSSFPVFAGDTLFGQFFYRDGTVVNFSNAVYFTVLP